MLAMDVLVSAANKILGSSYHHSDSFLSLIGTGYAIANALGRFTFGIYADYFGIRLLYTLMFSAQVVVAEH